MLCYDAPAPDPEAPVLIYEPQSHATPVREAAAAAAIAARRSRAQRRRLRRQVGGVDATEGGGGSRVGCVTEILWDDVQRARDLLRLSRRRKQEVQLAAAVGEDDGQNLYAPVSATPALRRLRRLNGRSASLDSRAGDAAQTTPSSAGDFVDMDADNATSATSGGAAGGDSGRRLGDLRRKLRDLMMSERRAECPQSGVCNASSIDADESSELSMLPRLRQVTQFPLAVRGCSTGDDEGPASSQLRQLQDEAAVQAALVAANRRLLGECPSGRLSSRMKRRRTLEFAKSQEKLQSLNARIAEIRTRDLLAPAPPPPLETLPDLAADDADGCGLSLCSLTSLAATELPAPAAAAEPPRQLRKFSSLTSASSATSSEHPPPSQAAVPGGISHAGSLDSGFLEIQALPDLRN